MMKYSGVTFLAPLDWVEGGCPPFRATVDRMLWHIHTHILLSRMLSLRLKVNLENGTKDRTPFGSSQIYTHSSARKNWIFVQCEWFTRPTCTATIFFLLFSFCITDTSMDTDLRNPWNVRPDFWSVTAVFWVFFVVVVVVSAFLSPRKLQRHVYDEDRPIYNVTLNSWCFFAYVLLFVYINPAITFP